MITRTLQFPIDHSLGKLLYRDNETNGEWLEFTQAIGTVSIRNNIALWLEIARDSFDYLPAMPIINNDVIEVIDVTNAGLSDEYFFYFQRLSCLRGLAAGETSLGDKALEYIGKLTTLEWLDIGDTKVTNKGLRFLSSLMYLKKLSLLDNKINEEGLNFLLSLPVLEHLDLMGTNVGDESSNILLQLQSLTSLRLYDTKITEDTYYRIKKGLPNCKIMYKHYHYPED